ncbi:unnamed protein product, partial [Prorocentrum cordatum]
VLQEACETPAAAAATCPACPTWEGPAEVEPCDTWGVFVRGAWAGGAIGCCSGVVLAEVVSYAVGMAGVLVHQRWVSGRMALSASEFVGATPNGDTHIVMYDEGENDDVDLVRWSAVWNCVPRGVNPARVHRFAVEPSAAKKQVFLRDAELLAFQRCQQIAGQMGRVDLLTAAGFVALVPGGHGAVAGTAVAAAPGPVAGPLRGVLQGAAAAAQVVADGGARWRAAQSLGDVRFGDEVPGHMPSFAVVHGRDFHILADGTALFPEEVAPADLEAFEGRAVAAGARAMPMLRAGASREIAWAAVAARVREEDFGRDWLVAGLEPTQWGVQEHHQRTQYIRLQLFSDQCDGANLQAREAIFRRMQTMECVCSEKVREQEGANQ